MSYDESFNEQRAVGRVGRVEYKAMPNSRSLLKFDIATKYSYDDKNTGKIIEKVTWHKVLKWNPSSFLIENVKKGTLIDVTGRTEKRRYETSDGRQGEATEIIAEKLRVLQQSKVKDNAVNDDIPEWILNKY